MKRFLSKLTKHPVVVAAVCFTVVVVPQHPQLIDLFWWLRK